MNKYINELEAKIEAAKKELDHLAGIEEELEQNKDSIRLSEYDAERQSIENHRKIQEEVIEQANSTIESYKNARDLVKDMKKLNNAIASSTNSEELQQLKEETEAKSKELSELMSNLPDELRDDIQNLFLTSENAIEAQEESVNMSTREEIEQAIETHQQEVEKMQRELEELKKVEKDMSIQNYSREYENIQKYLSQANEKLSNAQNVLSNYDKSKKYILELKKLETLISTERDKQTLAEMNEELEAKNRELAESLSYLSAGLESNLRDSIEKEIENEQSKDDAIEEPVVEETNEPSMDNTVEEPVVEDTNEQSMDNAVEEQVAENQSQNRFDINELRTLLDQVNIVYQSSIDRMNAIFTEERERQENEGPFNLEQLNEFQDYYMKKKVAENETFMNAKRLKESLEQEIAKYEREHENTNENQNEADKKNEIVPFYDFENQVKGGTNDKTPVKTSTEKLDKIKDNAEKAPKGVRNPSNTHNSKGEPGPIDMEGAKKEPLLGITGPTIKDRPLGIPGPTIDDQPLGLPGPTLDDDKTAGNDGNNGNGGNNGNDDKGKDGDDNTPVVVPPTGGDDDKGKGGDKPKKTPTKRKPKAPQQTLYGVLKKIRGDVITQDNIDVFKKKNVDRYQRSNLKVAKQCREEFKTGNYLYNIVGATKTVVKAGMGFLQKLSGKILQKKETADLMDQLRENASKLSEEDLEVLFNEYKGNKILNVAQLTGMNVVIQEVLSEYILGKVTALNTKIEDGYREIINAKKEMDAIDDRLNNDQLKAKDKKALLSERKKIAKKVANIVDIITESKIEADALLSNGLHGLNEDLKAKASKMNFVGKRFSKESFDVELDDKLAELEYTFKNSKNPEEKVDAFIEFEKLHSEHTVIESSVFGKRSVGEKYYSPLAEQLDYNPDPFVRDLLTTVAITSSVLSTANAFRVEFKNEQILTQQQAEALRVNTANDQAIGYANQAGQDIINSRPTIMKGFEAQATQDGLTVADTIERGTLDSTEWGLGTSAYRAADHAGHTFYNNFFNSTKGQIQQVAQDYSSQVIDQATALQQMAQISSNAQSTLVNVVDQCYKIAAQYAKNNPQFDLTAVTETMDFIVKNPTAIADMNQAIVDISGYGEGLVGLTAEHMTALQSLPSDLGTTLLAAASGAALAANVASEMKKNHKKGKYGNSVTDMMDEYINGQEMEEEEEYSNQR